MTVVTMIILIINFEWINTLQNLHSFPTRRSSDLAVGVAAEDPEVVEGLFLEVRVGRAAGNLRQDLPGPGGAALGEDEEGALLQLRRRAGLQELLEERNGALGIGVEQAVDGHQLQVLVVLGL